MDGIAHLALEAVTASVVFASLAVVAATAIALVLASTAAVILEYGGWMFRAARIAVLGPPSEQPATLSNCVLTATAVPGSPDGSASRPN
jgi:hypothetical protein